MMTITPVHTRVKGRARIFISGLKRSESFKNALETQLMTHTGVTRVSISLVTGTVLIFFNASSGIKEIIAFIRQTAGPFAKPETKKRRIPSAL